ncbi:MAG: monofunctional biosynthetic peptidoglycan transglycosylase [Gammaproteobacteria bacterium]|nr:monofunctional biosynthetic peptidoglycan transglycosylase [Gammaproteobacteria bacterium]MDH5800988.1 monofunctional biosynthetic peptidoglycan transglycosylase [Gammaproteobacteria bacterium]
MIKSLFDKVDRWIFFSKIGAVLLLALLLVETGFVLGLMPDWEQFIHGPIQKSRIIMDYEYLQTQNKGWPSLQWNPIPLSKIPKTMLRSVVVAEDSRFYKHDGFDEEAFQKAMEYNLRKGRFVYGASTISQQTVKNLFLTTSKSPLRKLHEAIITWAMEKNVGKKRILEIYLNIAEFGRGVYGVDAAARYYFGKPAGKLTQQEAIELAATLPAPVKHNPRTRTAFFKKHRDKIQRNLGV